MNTLTCMNEQSTQKIVREMVRIQQCGCGCGRSMESQSIRKEISPRLPRVSMCVSMTKRNPHTRYSKGADQKKKSAKGNQAEKINERRRKRRRRTDGKWTRTKKTKTVIVVRSRPERGESDSVAL